MRDPTDDNIATWRRILWDVSLERRTHARHSETLRASVTNYLLVTSSGLVALITFDKVIGRGDLALALLLVGVGLLGILFNASYIERYHRNRRRASDLIREIDRLGSVAGHPTLAEIEEHADAQHFAKGRLRRVYRIASTHWLWLAFPAAVLAIGLVVTVLSLIA